MQLYGLQPIRLFCSWDSPSKNTWLGCHALLQRIFPTQESSLCFLCLLHWQAGSLPVVPSGMPNFLLSFFFFFFLITEALSWSFVWILFFCFFIFLDTLCLHKTDTPSSLERLVSYRRWAFSFSPALVPCCISYPFNFPSSLLYCCWLSVAEAVPGSVTGPKGRIPVST